jgi:hypothetical protein
MSGEPINPINGDNWLEEKFANGPERKGFSYFFDGETADMAYKAVIRYNKGAIYNWLKGGSEIRRFYVAFAQAIGYAPKRNEYKIELRSRAMFTFTRTKDGPRVITAYPIEQVGSLEECEILEDKFNNLWNLLGLFEYADWVDKKDIDVIMEFVTKNSELTIQNTISEGEQLLELDEFPYEWIDILTCYRIPTITDGGIERLVDATEENYRNWIKWIIEEVKRQAKKQGKFDLG